MASARRVYQSPNLMNWSHVSNPRKTGFNWNNWYNFIGNQLYLSRDSNSSNSASNLGLLEIKKAHHVGKLSKTRCQTSKNNMSDFPKTECRTFEIKIFDFWRIRYWTFIKQDVWSFEIKMSEVLKTKWPTFWNEMSENLTTASS